MKKLMMSTVLFLCSSIGAWAQNFNQEPLYFVGSGTDTAYLVVDFQDQTFDTSYVWGYLFSSSTDGETMLNDIANEDVNLDVVIGGGFLNEIHYGSHSGVGGTNGFYWGTWSGTTIQNLASNSGIGETVSHKDIFACSFTDFSPAIEAGMPIAAMDSSVFTYDNVAYWYGSGVDTTVLVVDFKNGEQPVAFGYLSDGTPTAEIMMNELATYDVNLSINIAGGFLNQITYNDSTGLNGTNGLYWGTWSASNVGYWEINSGVSEVVGNVNYFGCSFTDFSPALRPSYPKSAVDPYLLSNADVDFWIGSGSDTSLLVVDFNDGGQPESFVWGYLYDDSQNVTASDMLNEIAANDVLFSVNLGTFLNDIEYDMHAGLAGNPYYWSTWSATNTGNWRMNTGVGEVLSDGDWFGCSYEAWPPPAPGVPVAAPENGLGVKKFDVEVQVYPNPFVENISIKMAHKSQYYVNVYNENGKLIVNEVLDQNNNIQTQNWSKGVYLISILNQEGTVVYTEKIIKQ